MRIMSVVLVAFALVLSACGDDDTDATDSETTTSDTAEITTTTGAVMTTATADVATSATEQALYFARGETLAVGGAAIEGADPDALVRALLAGPDEFEVEIGMHSEIPDETSLVGVEVVDGTAMVDLSSAFESGGGSLSMQLRVAQVVYTLTALGEVDAVTFMLDGQAVDGIGGEGVQSTDLTRDSVASSLPAVLVEAPLPGQPMGDSITVSGTLSGSAATITITDGEGLIIAEGPAESTDGRFGVEFDDLTPQRSGFGAVIAESEGVTYEVPIVFE